MIDACPESAVLFFDVDGTLTSFDPDDMTDKDFNAVHPSKAVEQYVGAPAQCGSPGIYLHGSSLVVDCRWPARFGACGCRCHGGSDARDRGTRGA